MRSFSRYVTRVSWSAALVVASAVAAIPAHAQPSLEIATIEVLPGQVGALLPVSLTSADAVDGFQLGITYDPLVMEVMDVSYDNGVLAGIPLELSSVDIDPMSGTLAILTVLDSTPPFDTQIPPGTDQQLLDLVIDIEQALFPGMVYPVQFADLMGNPPVLNQVFVEGMPQAPFLSDGQVIITNDNFVIVRDSSASPGTLGHMVEVSALNSQNVQGFSIVLTFDPELAMSMDITISDTITEAVGAEFVDPIFNNSEGFVILGVLLDALPPFEGQTIPAAGLELTIAKFIFDILPEANEVDSIPLSFVDGLGDPPISNIFVIDNQSVTPQFVNGVIEIIQDAVFIRGDANNDVDINIADPIATLAFLQGNFDPPCLLASDSDDDNVIGMADPIFTLLYLFQGGPPIPAPFPDPGVDPTPGDPPLPCDL